MNKARKEKQRQHQQKLKDQEQQALERAYARLSSSVGGFARTKPKKGSTQPVMPSYPAPRTVNHSHDRFTPFIAQRPTYANDPLMRERQAAALKRTREIQKRIDVPFNKGGLQLLTEGEFQAMKRGELRRRS